MKGFRILFYLIAELPRPEGSPISIKEGKGNPWIGFLVVFMASGIACGRLRATATKIIPKSLVVNARVAVVTLEWAVFCSANVGAGVSLYQ